jgi:hypothetical protein
LGIGFVLGDLHDLSLIALIQLVEPKLQGDRFLDLPRQLSGVFEELLLELLLIQQNVDDILRLIHLSEDIVRSNSSNEIILSNLLAINSG